MRPIPATCRAAVAVAPGVSEIQDLPVPAIMANTGLLEVEVTGVCGSDWRFYNGFVKSRGALVIGHETVGRIAAAGVDARARWGLQEGDRVALEEYVPCGHCHFCKSGDFRHCRATDWRAGGLRYGATELKRTPGLWGGFAQYQHLAPTTMFHKVPDGMPGRMAALGLPASNGIEWAYLQGRAGPGDVVVIQGPGQQGLSCVVAAREAGASKIIVTGRDTGLDRRRLALARHLGADHTIAVGEDDLLETLADLTGGDMASLVIDCTGNAEATIASFQIVRKTGRVMLAGQLPAPLSGFNLNLIIDKFLTVRGMRGHSYQAVELALQLIHRNAHNICDMSTGCLVSSRRMPPCAPWSKARANWRCTAAWTRGPSGLGHIARCGQRTVAKWMHGRATQAATGPCRAPRLMAAPGRRYSCPGWDRLFVAQRAGLLGSNASILVFRPAP